MTAPNIDTLVARPPTHGIFFPESEAEARVQYYRGEEKIAFELVSIRAEAGFSAAQAILASMYLNTWVDRDDYLDVAIRWAESSASKNNAYGYWILAWARLEKENWVDGFDAVLCAAELDFPPAIFDLGVFALYGDLVTQNVEQAIKLLQKSANAGHVHSGRALQSMRARGQFGIWQKFAQLMVNPFTKPIRFIHAIVSAKKYGPERLIYHRNLHVRNNFKRKVRKEMIDSDLERELTLRFDRIRKG